MPNNSSIGLSYLDIGEGDPVLLLHGFALNKEVNWIEPGWISALETSGHRAIAVDLRGHGQSTKSYEPADYHTDALVDDCRAILDHLHLDKVSVIGNSFGARIAMWFAVRHPARVRSLVLTGLGLYGSDFFAQKSPQIEKDIIEGLEAASLDAVKTAAGHRHRELADRTQSDLRALVSVMRGTLQPLNREQMQSIKVPVLIPVGEDERASGYANVLAATIPRAQIFNFKGSHHVYARHAKSYKRAVIRFLQSQRHPQLR
jgi:pimeloyl-ACP methyl ester carboxylesterase